MGNYLEQFWSNTILVLLLARPKPLNFMTYGSLDFAGPLVYGFDIPIYSKQYKKQNGNIFEIVFLYIPQIGKLIVLETCRTGPSRLIFVNIGNLRFCQLWKRRAPGNSGNPLNKVSKIMDMRSISS